MFSTCVRTFLASGLAAVLCAQQAAGSSAASQGFLGSRDGLTHGRIAADILAELEIVVGKDGRMATERRVARLENALRPMFLSMPKDSAGNLHATSVRYLLHRLFVQRHGWFVNGLNPASSAWNSSSPADIFGKYAGEDVHNVFNRKLSTAGFSLHQVAVFAATLEALVHTDSIERLEAAYNMKGFSKDGALTDDQVTTATELYMMMYVLNINHTATNSVEMKEAVDTILEVYPTWPDTQTFVQGVRESVLADVEVQDRTTWNTTLRVLEEVSERYGKWQDKECHSLKDELIKMDEDGNGRVPLERFYEKAITNSSWQFLESVPYLRQLGALDESDAQRLSVIIPNYINSPSNCVASSKFYAVCCIHECEALLGSLETHIGAPEAQPALLAQLVSGLKSSSTVNTPRQLDASLLARLDEIAAHHGGMVPLHGRLFAQWMHHAYPRECNYPHSSGTTNPLGAEEFYEQFGEEVEATHEEIWGIMNKTSKLTHGEQQALPWTVEEEMFVHRHERVPSLFSRLLNVLGQLFAFGAAIVAMGGLLYPRLVAPRSKGMVVGSKDSHKYYV